MHCSTHSRQNCSVASSDPSGSGRAGGSWCEGCQLMVKVIRSPGATAKSAYVVRFSPYVSASVSSHTESGPATATVRLSTLCTQGVTRP